MKISIKEKDNKEFNIKVPLFVGKIILSCSDIKGIKPYRPYFNIIYKSLKQYIKVNGHFELLNVESDDIKVKIIV